MWVSWQSTDPYLSEDFFNPQSSLLLSAFTHWIDTEPITADTGFLASYEQVELVVLGCGLAFRALWIVQSPDRYFDVPARIINSPYPFSVYEQLGHSIDDLLSGYAETYVPFVLLNILQLSNYVHRIEQVKAYYAHQTQLSKQGTSKDIIGATNSTREADTAVVEDDSTVRRNITPAGSGAAGGNGTSGGKGKKGSDGPNHRQ